MVNRLENFGEEPEGDEIEELFREFSEEHPEVPIRIMKADTPEAKKKLAEMYMNSRPKHPEQVVAYETEMQGPYTRQEWPAERAFIEKAFKMGMFNKVFYHGPSSGEHDFIRDVDHLNRKLDRIGNEFERNLEGTLKYLLGMNLEVQGYDSKKQRLITENDIRKFKGI